MTLGIAGVSVELDCRLRGDLGRRRITGDRGLLHRLHADARLDGLQRADGERHSSTSRTPASSARSRCSNLDLLGRRRPGHLHELRLLRLSLSANDSVDFNTGNAAVDETFFGTELSEPAGPFFSVTLTGANLDPRTSSGPPTRSGHLRARAGERPVVIAATGVGSTLYELRFGTSLQPDRRPGAIVVGADGVAGVIEAQLQRHVAGRRARRAATSTLPSTPRRRRTRRLSSVGGPVDPRRRPARTLVARRLEREHLVRRLPDAHRELQHHRRRGRADALWRHQRRGLLRRRPVPERGRLGQPGRDRAPARRTASIGAVKETDGTYAIYAQGDG